jgi:hypothetical protein
LISYFQNAGDCAAKKFRPTSRRDRTGFAIRLRRIAISDIAPGALVDGTDLLFAGLGYQIDNMEGLSVHLDSNRDTILTLISDDNFSVLQRTVLLQFKLVES